MVSRGDNPVGTHQSGIVDSFTHALARDLPAPPPDGGREWTRNDVDIDNELFRRALDAELVVHCDEEKTYRTTRALWRSLKTKGVIDEDGAYTGCGDGGVLDCGGDSFTNEGGVLKCKHCNGETSVETARERL